MSRASSRGRRWRRIRRRVLDRDGWRCRSCGKAGRLEVHHVVPVEQGGTDAPINLQVLCVSCHLSTHSRPDPQRDAWTERVKNDLSG